MPIYEYKCERGHHFEVTQRMSEDALATCEECGAPVERVFHPVAVHFKGSGFYTTDYKSKSKAAGDGAKSSDDSKPKESKDSKKDSGDKASAGKD